MRLNCINYLKIISIRFGEQLNVKYSIFIFIPDNWRNYGIISFSSSCHVKAQNYWLSKRRSFLTRQYSRDLEVIRVSACLDQELAKRIGGNFFCK